MQSEFARDLADIEGPIEDAARERHGKPIKVRVQPTILREVAGRQPQYRAWKDVSWLLVCDTPGEVFAARDAMIAFFAALTRLGPVKVIERLTAAEPAKKGAA